MKLLKTENYHNKIEYGRVKSGLEFLGFRITLKSTHPTIINSISAKTSRRVSSKEQKIAPPLYEQGASRKRIGQTLRRRLGCSIVVLALPISAAALPDGDGEVCTVSQLGGNSVSLATPISGQFTVLSTSSAGLNVMNPSVFAAGYAACFTMSSPDSDDSTCEGPNPYMIPDTATSFYANYTAPGVPFRCVYEVTLDPGNGTAVAVHNLQLPPTAVPIFTPLGIIATISGLLWFGRRRLIKVKSA